MSLFKSLRKVLQVSKRSNSPNIQFTQNAFKFRCNHRLACFYPSLYVKYNSNLHSIIDINLRTSKVA
jgi:hypothetical protein